MRLSAGKRGRFVPRADSGGPVLSASNGVNFDDSLITDRKPRGAHHRLADAKGKPPAARRHDARRELDAAYKAMHALLLEATQLDHVFHRDVANRQTASLVRVPIPDAGIELDRFHGGSPAPVTHAVKTA